MAGRGRQNTLPAWMTSGASTASIPSFQPPAEGNQFEDYYAGGSGVNSSGMEYQIRPEPERLYSDLRDTERSVDYYHLHHS
jgi:hypothetical protein